MIKSDPALCTIQADSHRFVLFWCFMAVVAGCQTFEMVSFQDQHTALLEIAPLGTPRAEVAKKLKQAGVKYEPSKGSNPGVFHCVHWEMETGEQYYLYSDLLFDSDGLLQEIREIDNNFYDF